MSSPCVKRDGSTVVENRLNDKLRELEERLARLEEYLGLAGWKPTPGFDAAQFHRILMGYFAVFWGLFVVLFLIALPLVLRHVGQISDTKILGLPLVNTQFPAQVGPSVLGLPVGVFVLMGIGAVSFGGFAIGVVAFGGGAIGIVAIGGGAVGLIAFGGGAIGLVAFGGGAAGYIAVGGGAWGTYVLAADGRGRFVFDRKRQDPEAVSLFCRCFPRLRRAFKAEHGRLQTY
jgi:hypothetical protein